MSNGHTSILFLYIVMSLFRKQIQNIYSIQNYANDLDRCFCRFDVVK